MTQPLVSSSPLLVRAELISLENNPAAVYLATLKQSSRRPQKQALNLIASLLTNGAAECLTLDWSQVRYQHTAAIRSKLMDGYSPATANRILSALRGVLQQAWLLGQMSAEDYHRAARINSVIGETLPVGRELLAEEIQALLDDCVQDDRISGVRDAAVISIMYSGGLRREEVTKLDIDDYIEGGGKLIVRGKRSKERTAYLAEGAIAALADWLGIRGAEIAGPLFLAITKLGKIMYHRRLTPQAIYVLLTRRAKRAGVESFSPHDLRRTFVSDLLDAGVDLATVAKMAGHSNIQTTARYDRRPEKRKQDAANLLKIPYQPINRSQPLNKTCP